MIDGIRTSGQLDPVHDLLKPYEAFPEEISGPTVWRAEDYRDAPERWTHRFTEEEIEELGAAADKFIASDIPMTGISKACLTGDQLSSQLANLASRNTSHSHHTSSRASPSCVKICSMAKGSSSSRASQ